MVNFFEFLKLITFFDFVVALCDPVASAQCGYYTRIMLTANNYKLQFPVHHSYFREDFQMLLTVLNVKYSLNTMH